MNELCGTYRDRVQFYCVYIQEAHPTDGWQVAGNLEAGVLYAQPKSLDERAEVASACAVKLDLRMPVLLDAMTNDVDEKYAALPERLYVLDADSKVFFKTVMGSMGFDVEAWAKAIEEIARS
jgi:Iodothyronine deiodinase